MSEVDYTTLFKEELNSKLEKVEDLESKISRYASDLVDNVEGSKLVEQIQDKLIDEIKENVTQAKETIEDALANINNL